MTADRLSESISMRIQCNTQQEAFQKAMSVGRLPQILYRWARCFEAGRYLQMLLCGVLRKYAPFIDTLQTEVGLGMQSAHIS